MNNVCLRELGVEQDECAETGTVGEEDMQRNKRQ